jgi:cell division protein DivIC
MTLRNNPLRDVINKLPAPLRNKYILVILVFLVVVFFLDRHNFFTQLKLNKSVKQLEHDKDYYSKKIEAKTDKQSIEKDKEKFAREKYHMHEADEDVFIIEKEN